MGMSAGAAGSDGAMRDPNVTPIIDVMLVLLIIFMVVTPLTQAGHDVELPESAENVAQDAQPDPNQLVLSIDSQGNVSINKQDVATEALPSRIRDLFEPRADKTIFLRAAPNLNYGEVVAVLDICRGNGVERVGIVPPDP